MKILIGADFVPTKSNISLFESGNVEELFGKKLTECLNHADYRIFNLEVPLADLERPILKRGPNLIAPTKCATGYQAIHADLLTLANNHILDQGVQGLESTIRTLKRAGISYIGAGTIDDKMIGSFVFQCDDRTVGVYACAEHEFSIVKGDCAGANPINLIESMDSVAELKKHCDFIIVLYHGGKEYYRYPSPQLQSICRKFIEKGAGLVICQHSHCIGCEEKYGDGTIVYGQGNFLFDDDDNEYYQTSLLVSLVDGFRVEYIPLVKRGNAVRMAETEDAKKILGDFSYRSKRITEDGFIEAEYEKFASEYLNNYLAVFSRKNEKLVFKVLNRVTRGKWRKYFSASLPLRYKLAILNYVECEAHRELLIAGLKESCGLK